MPKEQQQPLAANRQTTNKEQSNVKRPANTGSVPPPPAQAKATRQQSAVSMESIGIGQLAQSKQMPKSNMSQSSRSYNGFFKLRPSGNHSPNKVVYDCVVYLIYCSAHNRFAVTSGQGGQGDEKSQSTTTPVWFPFVARHGRTWLNATNEGLLTLFERSQATNDKYKDETEVVRSLDFEYNVRCMEVFRLEVAEKSWVKRMTQFVTITKCNQTCQPINNLRWLEAGEMIEQSSQIMWGPEFAIYYNSYLVKSKYLDIVISEHPIKQIMNYINDANDGCTTHVNTGVPCNNSSATSSNKSGPAGNQRQCLNNRHDTTGLLSSLIQSAEITAEKLRDLYEDYLSHTFPSYFMTITSFRVYLRKCGLNLEDDTNVIRGLFSSCLARRTCTTPAKSGQTPIPIYLDFLDICYVMIATDPSTPHQSNRLRFVFAYYDQNRDGLLNSAELQMMLADISSLAGGKINNVPGSYNNGRVTFAELEREIAAGRLQGTELLCRWPYSQFDKLESNRKNRGHQGTSAMGADDNSTSIGAVQIRSGFSNSRSRNDQVYCPNCQLKSFEYGQHYITLNTNGRCVEPTLIPETYENQYQAVKPGGKYQYSLEYVFHTASYGNVLFDYIRDKKFDVTAQSDQKNLCEYFRLLCSSVAELFKHEPKLIKRQSPTLVVGNINGNLDSLFSIQNNFWVNMPIIADNICFLGNYSGGGSSSGGGVENSGSSKSTGSAALPQYGLEVIIYLFSMKYINPNKVILLRGIQETRQYNQRALLDECRKRYDEQLGRQIWESINSVFDHLPYVAIVNESVICTSSGIPKDSVKSKLAHLFENYSHHSSSTSVDTSTINVAAAAATGNNDSVSSNSQTTATINDQCSIFQQIMTNIPEIKPGPSTPTTNGSNSNKSSSASSTNSKTTMVEPSRSVHNKINSNSKDRVKNANNNNNKSGSTKTTASASAAAPVPANTSLFRPNPAQPNSYRFTCEAFKQFMSLNQFSFMIRGNHQRQAAAPPARQPTTVQRGTSSRQVAMKVPTKRRVTKSTRSSSSCGSLKNVTGGDTIEGEGFRIQFNRSCITIANNGNPGPGSYSDPSSSIITVAFVTHPQGKIQLIQFECNEKTSTNSSSSANSSSATTILTQPSTLHRNHQRHQRHHRQE